MGKNYRGSKEFSKEQKLIHENQRLKRQISTLRKQLARLDLDRYGNIKETLEEHYALEEQITAQQVAEKMKNEWKCHKCADGFLEIVTYNKMDEIWYRRECSECDNTTKAQIYTPNVAGIKKEIVKKPLK